MRINDLGIEAIEETFGNIENFIKQDSGSLKVIENLILSAKDEVIEDTVKEIDKLKVLQEAQNYKQNQMVEPKTANKKVRVEDRKQ